MTCWLALFLLQLRSFESHTLKPELRISKRTKSSLLVIDMVMAIAR